MPAVTVKDVLKFALPTGTEVVAGEAGLGREVKWARTFRTRAPALDSLDGGELALLSVSSAMLDDERSLPYIIERLTEGGVAALAVAGEISSEARAQADRLGTPLLSLPRGVALNEVEKLVVGLILNREAELQERGVQIYRQLAQLSIEDKGITAIVEALSRITGKAVAVQDEKLKLQHIFCPLALPIARERVEEALHDGGAFGKWLEGVVLNSTSPPISRFDVGIPGMSRFVAPIIVKGIVGGYVSVFGHADEMDELDRVATGRAASVSAIEIIKQRAIVEAESRVLGDFLDDLLTGNFATEQALLARARVLGYDLSIPYAVLVFGLDASSNGKKGGADGDNAQKLRHDFIAQVSDAIIRQQSQSLLSAKEDTITILFPEKGGDPVSIKRTAEQVRQQVVGRLGSMAVSVGIGRFYPQIRDLQKGYREAERALAIGQRLFGGNRTVHFNELGIYRLLFPLQSTLELTAFYEETLASLVDYDRQHDAQLVKTLEAFFACHGNLSKTAEGLFLHRNTLIYRMERIAEITGLNLDNPEDRLSLQVALKIKEIQAGPN